MKTFLAIMVVMGAAVLPVEDPVIEDERGPKIDYQCLAGDIADVKEKAIMLDAICRDGEHEACYLAEALRAFINACEARGKTIT